MAAPNLISLTTVNTVAATLALTTSETDLIASVGTGHAFNVAKIQVTNIHDTATGNVTIAHKVGGTDFRLAYKKTIPVKTSVDILLGGAANLAAGDSITALASADSTLEAIAYYTDMS